MPRPTPTLSVQPFRSGWAIFAGCAVLCCFTTEAEAQADLKEKPDLYSYLADSPSVSVQNSSFRRIGR